MSFIFILYILGCLAVQKVVQILVLKLTVI